MFEIDRRARRWRRATIAAFAVLGLGLLALVAADYAGLLGYRGDDHGRYHGRRLHVLRVIDGDTLKIRGKDGPESVRLIGIDAPEVGRPGAAEATEALRALTNGGPIELALQPAPVRDRYGRLLAYVHSGPVHVNRALVEHGHAYAERRFPHPYGRDFAAAERAARGRKLGLWRDHDDDEQPPWRRRWLEERR